MWGAQEKSEGAHQKIFGRRFAPALGPHLKIASDATAHCIDKGVILTFENL